MVTTSSVKQTVLHIGDENDDSSCGRVMLWHDVANYGYELSMDSSLKTCDLFVVPLYYFNLIIKIIYLK